MELFNYFFQAASVVIMLNAVLYNFVCKRIAKKNLFALVVAEMIGAMLINTVCLNIKEIQVYNGQIIDLLLNVTTYIYLRRYFKKPIVSFALIVLSLVIIYFFETVVGVLYMLCFLDKGMEFLVVSPFRIIALTITIIASAFFGKFLSKPVEKWMGKIEISEKANMQMKSGTTILVFLFLGLGILAIVLLEILINKTGASENISFRIILIASLGVVLLSFVYLVGIILNGRVIRLEMENKKNEEEVKMLREHSEMIEQMYSELRSFRHDYINIISSLGLYAEEGDIKGFQEYFRTELLPESEAILIHSNQLRLIDNIKVGPLKALFLAKLNEALNHGLKLDVKVTNEIEHINMKVLDVCRIMGVLLDNAIEASAISAKKRIILMIINDKSQVKILIANSCPENTPPVFKMFEKDFSTKGENRGYGLNAVRSTIDKRYKNVTLNTRIRDDMFEQELIVRE